MKIEVTDEDVRSELLTYEVPALVRRGSLDELTNGNLDGDASDQAFPVHTPKPDLRFS